MCFSVCPRGAHHPIECIVPPHMLRVIALRGDERMAEMAKSLLKQSQKLRQEREDHIHPVPAPDDTAPPFGAVAGRGRTRLAAAAACEPDRRVHDGQHRAALPGPLVRSEGDGPCGIADADRMYDAMGEVFGLYADQFDRNSLDGNGLPLIATVNHRRNYNNAFWNGDQMAFGNGDGKLFKTFIDLSVIAHEMTHGVIQYSGGLVYQDQAGALNESIADVFAAIAQQRNLGQTAHEADWIIGGELLGPDINGSGLRSMKAPGTAYHDDLLGQDPQPFHMDNFLSTSDDNGGVHINSGIPNHAFYLFCMLLGGNSWEKPGQIWYRALQDLNNPMASFAEWSDQTVGAAINLYGMGSTEMVMLRRAWKLVGLPT
ncbi:M4 family metallopeptidase [Paracoccus stylophorae]|uniref:Neutral metalloproteinase n=1 Tax=Paracoccus stylophorae TaxID=659350 RepID=A0ABY7SXN7_9RHOB|nr:M4 family metallopeptidase [Paracoccus stylophorae]WCR11696.1 M4 family metallopeptidase [Paracoccus stylophorae]